ncbi:hypothetical protein PLESTF_000430400 [Pleodorina starrii]|nr:hypothetical protein PLESTF_000430400 [Pleodorina starrii]
MLPPILAAAYDAEQAANPELHKCGCTCAPCSARRRLVQLKRLNDKHVEQPPIDGAAVDERQSPAATDPAASSSVTTAARSNPTSTCCTSAASVLHTSASVTTTSTSASTSTSTTAPTTYNSDGAASSSEVDLHNSNNSSSSSSSNSGGCAVADRPPPTSRDEKTCGPSSNSDSTAPAATIVIQRNDVPTLDFSKARTSGDWKLLCHLDSDVYNRTVWRWWWARGRRTLLVKVLPCHSPKREAEIASTSSVGRRFPTPSGILAPVYPVRNAAREAQMAQAVPDGVFVQPLRTFLRRSSLAGGPHDTGHDMEVVIIYPYHRQGSAADHIFRLARAMAVAVVRGQREKLGMPAAASCGSDCKCDFCCDFSDVASMKRVEPETAAAKMAAEMYNLCLDMFGLTDLTHCHGFIIQDLKPANMVKTAPAGIYRFIDAEFVVKCSLDDACGTPYPGTEYYAAPEQQELRWSDARSDVHACGRSISSIVDTCLYVFRKKLQDAGLLEAHERLEVAFLAAVEPLTQLEEACTLLVADLRPTAAAAFDMLLSYMVSVLCGSKQRAGTA